MTGKKEYHQSLVLILLFATAGFIVYYPILGNTFLSDDYDSLYRIYIEKRIIYKEFLRPMIDISFYFNYLISGFSARSFYVFNVIVHIVNALLLLRFARSIVLFDEKDQFLFGLITAFIFLIYPFHNESVSWLSGRLSSMACLFALVSLILSEKKGPWFIISSVAGYLLGLLCYESIVVLPLIVVILKIYKNGSVKKAIAGSLYWVGATGFYIVVKLFLSGGITGSYGNRVVDEYGAPKILNTAKVFGRLFLPPSENHFILVLLTVICLIFLIALHFYLFKRNFLTDTAKGNYQYIVICLAISLLIPFAFGVSTNTSEGDRLLYFPSCFLCTLIGSWIVALTKKKFYRYSVLILVGFYFVWFLELNNLQWKKASVAAESIMNVIERKGSKCIVMINLPDESEGAFIFRNGFKKALRIKNIDTAQVKVVSYLHRSNYIEVSGIIKPAVQDSLVEIFPYTRIIFNNQNLVNIHNKINNERLTLKKDQNLIYYWNKEKLVKLF